MRKNVNIPCEINHALRRNGIRHLLNENLESNAYGVIAVAKMVFSDTVGDDVLERVNRAARWFELPYPGRPGRLLDGEPDFVAHALIRAIHQAEEKLPEETLNLIHAFFTEQQFESKYKSENHMLLFHEARYLYAIKYPNHYFKQYKKSAEEMMDEDRAFLLDFIRFRAQRGWAEFDSLGYGAEVFTSLLNLYDFGEPDVSAMAEMAANVMLLDMIMDCSRLEGFYGGAHGRIYENSTYNFKKTGMHAIYQYYFGKDEDCGVYFDLLASGFAPADYVYDVLDNRPDTWTNRESKHLHSITYQTPHKQVPQVPGSINKQTYVTPNYILGGVTWQDDYPEGSEAKWYAHHQQHEWELSILPNPEIRIFTHHPGSFGPEGKEHGYWTGDLGCCCGQFFSDKNIALATYDIPEQEVHFIHARVPFNFLETEIEDHFLWMKAENVYAVLWFSEGIAEGRDDLKDIEVRSYGRKHAVMCAVIEQDKCGSFENFKKMVKIQPPEFDRSSMMLSYGGLRMTRNERYINEKKVQFPYDTYDSPCVYSKFGSGIIETRKVILDFNGRGSVTYKV